MKLKATKKAIKDNYTTIIRIGYCNLINLLHYRQPFAYSAGSYGWACDYYEVDGVCISTGYNPIGNVSPNYKLVDEYEKMSRLITSDYSATYEEKKENMEALLKAFVNEATK